MKRIMLCSALALLAFAGLPRVFAARNAALAGPPRAPSADRQAAIPIGFNGGDFEDGGRSPFGQ